MVKNQPSKELLEAALDDRDKHPELYYDFDSLPRCGDDYGKVNGTKKGCTKHTGHVGDHDNEED